jgi:hypothetical protein
VKLFLIIYAGTQIGGAVGPLPDDLSECQRHRDQMRSAQAAVLKTGFSPTQKRLLTADELAKIRAMRFECEYFSTRPAVAA